MLTAILMAMLAGQPTAAPTSLPNMNHMAWDGLIGPRRSTVTVEWRCETSSKPSRATITITDSGRPSWNKNFRIELNSLSVEGKKPKANALLEVRSGLAKLNVLETFLGRCSGRSPGLFIKGYRYEGDRAEPEVMHLYLR